jgi:hypothetical protein
LGLGDFVTRGEATFCHCERNIAQLSVARQSSRRSLVPQPTQEQLTTDSTSAGLPRSPDESGSLAITAGYVSATTEFILTLRTTKADTRRKVAVRTSVQCLKKGRPAGSPLHLLYRYPVFRLRSPVGREATSLRQKGQLHRHAPAQLRIAFFQADGDGV